MTAIAIRRARPADVARIAGLHRAARRAALPDLPETHTAGEDRSHFGGLLAARRVRFLVAEAGGAQEPVAVGFVAFRPDFINHLYVDPAWFRRGVGTLLLRAALERTGAPVRLWTLRRNAAARAFYEARGFIVERETDGAENDEKEPAVLYRRDG